MKKKRMTADRITDLSLGRRREKLGPARKLLTIRLG
jgi:hypothetical protein